MIILFTVSVGHILYHIQTQLLLEKEGGCIYDNPIRNGELPNMTNAALTSCHVE